MNKYVYRFICYAILCVSVTVSFSFVWIPFVSRHNQTGNLMGKGNIIMALCIYAGIFCVNAKWLKLFTVGVERKAKVIASGFLTSFLTDIVEIFISMAITGQFRFFLMFTWRYVLLAIVQSITIAVIVTLMINLYRRIIPPLTILEVNGEYENNLAAELGAIKNQYSILETTDYRDGQLYEKINKYDAVLLNDIPSYIQKDIIKICFEKNKRVYLLPKLSDIIIKSSDDVNIVDTPLFLCKNIGINMWQKCVKRTMDLVCSIFALIILSPVFLAIAIAIKKEDGGPVFFKQERVTLHEKRFMILKFRSMIVDAEKDGKPHPAGERDDRITHVGRFIRATRIDELPQLINIIKGEMSIVGPRPERWEHVEKYKKDIPEFVYRYKVKGGLTGYAQVYGKYNTSALDKLKMDLIYIANFKLLLDVQIIFETLKILLLKDSSEGFNQKRIEEMHKFGE